MRKSLFIGCALALCSLAVAAAAPAHADTVDIKADLKGASETPPNDAKGMGTLTGTYSKADKKLTWTVTYSGLTGAVTAAHFHGPAPVGKAAPIEVPVKGPFESPMKGVATLSDSQAKDLMSGNMYFNLHTAAHKPGEIRGQVSMGK